MIGARKQDMPFSMDDGPRSFLTRCSHEVLQISLERLEAAGHELFIPAQKIFLQAASFGKLAQADSYRADRFVDM